MSDPRKFKGNVQVEGSIVLPNESVSKVLVIDGSGEIASSATTTTELSYLEGTTSSVQGQIDTVVERIDDLTTLSGVPSNSMDLGTFTGSIIPDNSTVKSAFQSLETAIEGLPDPMEYKGVWDASTNTPTLTDGTGNNGDVYYVNVAGTQFTPSITFAVGDKVVYNGALSKYEKWDTTESVTSVFGRTGAIVAQAGDYDASQVTNTPNGNISATTVQGAIDELDSEKFASADFNSTFDTRFATKSTTDLAEGTNLYFTDERAQDAIGGILVDSDTIDFTYNDSAPSIVADVKYQLSIDADASGIKLVNDQASPGNTKYYGTDGSGVKGFFSIPAVGSAGDIQETSFSASNNVSSPADVTGFAFASGTVRSFTALVSVAIDATGDLFEQFTLQGINKNGSFNMSVDSVGDNSGIVFSITSAGQIQYTSTNVSGFVSNTIKFRALTTTV